MPTPFPYIDRLVRVALVATQFGEERINVFNYKDITGEPTIAALEEMLSNLAGTLVTAYQAMANSTVSFNYLEARDLSVVDSIVVQEPLGNIPGSGGGDAMPGNVSLGVRYRTGYAGRSKHGRTEFFGHGEAETNGNVFSATEISRALAIATQYILGTSGGGHTFIPVVASHTHGTLIPITTALADIYVDSMRTRLQNRGA